MLDHRCQIHTRRGRNVPVMLKALLLGFLVVTICGSVYAAPLTVHHQTVLKLPQHHPEMTTTTLDPLNVDSTASRNERSTNLSHVTGTARKIQMFIKNRHLQILPDGTVNGTTDDSSAYTIFQRTTVGIGQVRVLGVATCQYLCMANCGILYGSKDFSDECVFNETIAQSNYNLYMSTKYSNEKRTLFLALNRRGQSRKVLVRTGNQLGKMSSYARVLTRTVSPEHLPHPLRHHAHVCATSVVHSNPIAHHRLQNQLCPKKRKRKKKKKKCPNDDNDSELCYKKQTNLKNKAQTHICDVNKDSVKCQRESKKRQKPSDHEVLVSEGRIRKKHKKGVGRRLDSEHLTTTTTVVPPSTISSEMEMEEEDYVGEDSTHDLDDSVMHVTDATTSL